MDREIPIVELTVAYFLYRRNEEVVADNGEQQEEIDGDGHVDEDQAGLSLSPGQAVGGKFLDRRQRAVSRGLENDRFIGDLH